MEKGKSNKRLIIKSLIALIILIIVGLIINKYNLWVYKIFSKTGGDFVISLILGFVIIGLIYFLSLLINFGQYFVVTRYKKIQYKNKYFFNCFTVIFMLITFVLILKILNTIGVIINLQSLNNNKLFTTVLLYLILAFSFWAFYFCFCVREIKQFKRIMPVQLFEKTIRSIMVALTAWLLISTNIGVKKEITIFTNIYIIIGSIIVLAYPIFDMFEFTYQEIDNNDKKMLE